ncbi:hypothetical protein KCP70_00605 [Salmonella enterica subsp. enterica]|nr:hypothetical protein KCP70_00605 [Salmonella enterica subsp. enterica]
MKEAEDGERVLRVMPTLRPATSIWSWRVAGNYQIKIHDGPPVNRHRRPWMCCFIRWQKHAGRNAVGVILTGMGSDGAAGMLAIIPGLAHGPLRKTKQVIIGVRHAARGHQYGGVSEVVVFSRVSQQMLKISGQAIRI